MKILTLCLLSCLTASAQSVKLAWDASPSTNVFNYSVYWGPGSRFYTNSINFGTNLTCTITNLVPYTTYWFAATAMDTNGVESDFSNEAKLVPPTNVVTFSVQILGASTVTGPYTLLTNLPAISRTNPVGAEFVQAVVGVTVTNVSK